MLLRLAPLVLLLLAAAPAPARVAPALALHALFTDGMVLQQDRECPVWGVAAPDREVTVEINGQTKTARSGGDGRFLVRLTPMKAGGPYELKVSAGDTVTVKDVLVGEVWVCSGQSNMEWPVDRSANPAEEKAAATYPRIRLFTVRRRMADEPQRDLDSAWVPCSPATVGGFSAVAYFFGRELHASLDVPVGLIHASWGGTPAELWTSRRVLDANEALKPLLQWHAAREQEHEQAVARHQEAAEKAKAEGKPPPREPRRPMSPACLYNGMIAPLLPYGIRGAIWYQGESNAGSPKLYETLFPALIRNWREDWGQGDFPFYFVQLANFVANGKWAELREAQVRALSLPQTGMAVAADIGDPKDIHPKNKQEVGRRLALWALARTYGRDLVHSGPLFEAMKVEEGRARLSFRHAGGGLVAKGGVLKEFTVAGEDGRFRPAEAAIEGNEVVVRSPEVPRPAAVRYAWSDNPECTLYNKEGLPASPFRTDGGAP